MILQALTQYGELLQKNGEVGSEGWNTAKVSYAITIDREGKVRNIQSLMTLDTKGKKEVLLPAERKVPLQKGRSSKISPNFMCDNAKYLLGAWQESGDEIQDEANSKKAEEYFQAAAQYHISLLSAIENENARSICKFFKAWDFNRDKELLGISVENLLSAANLIFRSFETMSEMQQDSEIAAAWNQYYNNDGGKEIGRCLVTGTVGPIARLHPLIKGVRGAQSSGAALVSYNGEAFESYGKIQGSNAPVSEYAASTYGKALNYLLEKKELHQIIGDTSVVYWSETGENDYADFFSELFGEKGESDNDKLIDVMNSIANGKPCRYKESDMKPDTRFYILGLSPNAARLSVRFFYEGTFGNIVSNIEKHYKRLEIQKPANVSYISVNKILYETVNKNSSKKEIQPILVGSFINSILNDTVYPESVFTNLIIRIRADKDINFRRAAMLKAFIIKNKPKLKEAVDFMELNENSDNTAYILGRLFAVLEDIQCGANGDLNTTIKDKFFVSACATPASVFPRLLKLSNSHLRVLKRDKPGLYNILNDRLNNIMVNMHEDFPKQLDLEEQGVFIIGYYHQLQKRYEKKDNKNTEMQEEK